MTLGRSKHAKARREWAQWLKFYTAEKLFDSIIANTQGAESTCVYCHQNIYLDIVEGGGVPDWGSVIPDSACGGLDYGCDASPESNEDGCGGHMPVRR